MISFGGDVKEECMASSFGVDEQVFHLVKTFG
jgi:hypothetical protein